MEEIAEHASGGKMLSKNSSHDGPVHILFAEEDDSLDRAIEQLFDAASRNQQCFLNRDLVECLNLDVNLADKKLARSLRLNSILKRWNVEAQKKVVRLGSLPAAVATLAACGGSDSDGGKTVGNNGPSEVIDDGRSDQIQSNGLGFQSVDVSDISNFTLPLIVPVDFNQDGAIDFLVTHGEFPRGDEPYPPEREISFVPFLLVNKDGELVRQEIFGDPPKLTHPRDFVIADFNNDGFPDVMIVGHGWDAPPFPGEANVLLYGGPDGFTDKSALLPGYLDFSHSVAAGDLTGNGYPDIYVGNIFGVLGINPYILINNMGESFDKVELDPNFFSATSESGKYTSSIISDVFVSGENLLIVGADAGEGSASRIFSFDPILKTMSLVKTLPDGLFGANTVVLDIKVGDVNGNGLNDIVLLQTQDYIGAGIQILIQNSEGVFVDETDERIPNFDFDQQWITFLHLVDLDGDGALDIVVSQPPKNGPIAYLNKDGVFESIDFDYATEFFDTLVDVNSGDVFASWSSNETLFFEQLYLV